MCEWGAHAPSRAVFGASPETFSNILDGAPEAARESACAPQMIELPPGEFVMGASTADKFANDTERPAHHVRFRHRFALGKFPATVGEYRRFAAGHAAGEDPALPVVNVSWLDAKAYCLWLAEQTGSDYRLPTEAEWEFACRAGSCASFACGDEITPAEADFLYDENGARIGVGARTPAGAYPPNTFGFHDLHGNVCEWAEDTWHPDYSGCPHDGSAWISGDETVRVIRGGAWDYLPRLLRSSQRDWLPRDARRDNVGFRVALTLEKNQTEGRS